MVQKLQNKVARIVTRRPFDAAAAPLLKRLGWPSVQDMVDKETSMVYKSLNSLAPQYLSDLFVRLCELHITEIVERDRRVVASTSKGQQRVFNFR